MRRLIRTNSVVSCCLVPMSRRCVDCGVRSKRPAPHPGPRCATHNREIRKARSEAAWALRISQTYSITAEEYWAVYEAQGGRCYICQRASGKTRRLSVDHDHATGEVRGLLCSRDNVYLGHIRDDVEAARRVADYLENPPARAVLRKTRNDD